MTPHPEDTIAAVSSAPGAGLRAIVRVTGPETRTIVGTLFQPQLPEDRRFRSGTLRLTGVDSALPAEVYFFQAPRTYTGQDLVEIHTLSSPPLVERLVADLLAAGARAAQPGEFTLRAFLAGKKDLPQAEAVLAVIESRTDADLAGALAQLAGGVSQPLHRLRDDLLNLLADVEAALDFVDEDIEFVAKTELLTRIAGGIAHLTNLRRQLDDRTVSGRSIRVAIVGEPNAGKSSLFNALTGDTDRPALVSDRPGTTRDYLTRTVSLGGIDLDLIDTAGWQHASDTIEEQAQRLGQEQSRRADVILWCVPFGHAFDAAAGHRLTRETGAELLRVRTKVDASPTVEEPGIVSTSAMRPDGITQLREVLWETVHSLARPPLAPSQSRCRAHVERAIANLRTAHSIALHDDPPELLAASLRSSLDEIGELAGTIHTDDLLDRIFSRFCIGK